MHGGLGVGGGGGRSLNDFKFGTFIGRFQSDDAASMAVKGLTGEWEHVSLGSSRTAWLTAHISSSLTTAGISIT